MTSSWPPSTMTETPNESGDVIHHDNASRSSSPLTSGAEVIVLVSSMVSKRFHALTASPSKETQQSLARWVLFHRAHPAILSSLVAIFDIDSSTNLETTPSTTVSLPRKLVFLNVIHEILIAESNKSTGGGDTLMWDKYHDFRMAVGESVLLPVIDSIRQNLKTASMSSSSSTDSNNVAQQVEKICERLKAMKDTWREVDSFDSPTLFDDISKALVLLEKDLTTAKKKMIESTPILVDASTPPIEHSHQVDSSMVLAQDNVDEEEIEEEEGDDYSFGQPHSSSSPIPLDDAVHDHPSDDLKMAGDDDHVNIGGIDQVSCGNAIDDSFGDGYSQDSPKKIIEDTSNEISEDHKTSLLPMKRKSQDEDENMFSPRDSPPRPGIMEQDDTLADEFDTQFIPLGKVEIQELDLPNKAIAAMQITRDLHGESTLRLSGLISTIPQSVLDTCQAIQDSSTTVAEAIKSADIQALPDEFLDMDLDGALASLRLYKDIIMKQKEARKKCIELLIKSQGEIGFSCKEAAKLFYSMDSKLSFLNKKKEKIRDAMELEGLDFEAMRTEVASEGDEEEPKEFSWYQRGDMTI